MGNDNDNNKKCYLLSGGDEEEWRKRVEVGESLRHNL